MFCLHVYLCTICMSGASKFRGSISSPGTRVMAGYRQLCACWELNPGPLQGTSALNYQAISPAPQIRQSLISSTVLKEPQSLILPVVQNYSLSFF